MDMHPKLKDNYVMVKGCAVFSLGCNPDGYGQKRVGDKVYPAHRLSFAYANNLSIADIKGQLVLHSCDNPPCINPEHLRLGTQQDNMDDMYARGRGHKFSKEFCIRGHRIADNPYIRKDTGVRLCSKCRTISDRNR